MKTNRTFYVIENCLVATVIGTQVSLVLRGLFIVLCCPCRSLPLCCVTLCVEHTLTSTKSPKSPLNISLADHDLSTPAPSQSFVYHHVLTPESEHKEEQHTLTFFKATTDLLTLIWGPFVRHTIILSIIHSQRIANPPSSFVRRLRIKRNRLSFTTALAPREQLLNKMDFTRRRIADISSYIPTSTLKSRGEAAPADAEATPNYHSNLDGVNQPMNLLFKDALWWTLGIMALVVLSIRIIEILWMRLRQVSAMNVSGSKQAYWKISQWSWMPNVKKNLIYAPLWNKRHNREFKLSSAISMGTLPSRLHFIILFIYLGSNFAYMFVLNWHNENKLAFCAELRGRSGTLALVNMVPLIIFAGRNNLLIGLLKISFDTYNLLHRWMGRIVVLESIIHTIAWLIVAVDDLGWDGVGHKLSHGLFEGSGAVGTVAMTFLLVLSVSPLRHAFYETFLNVHIVLAFVAFVATWIHCASSALKGGLPQLPWIMAIMAIWFADRLARMLRIVFVNWSSKGWTDAVCEAMPGNVTRVTLHLPRYVDIEPGTHAYLRFWGLCAWESHPFSICWVNHVRDNSLPIAEKDPLHAVDKSTMTTTVSFLIGAQTGFTKKLFDRASRCPRGLRIKAAMEGPYAGHNSLDSYGHAVLFAGSTGITHQISYIRHLLEGYNQGTTTARRITLVWIIREYESLEWVRPYMDTILRIPNRKDILRIQIFVTRPQNPRDIVSASATVRMFPGRPNVPLILAREVQEQMGAMCVTVCGPGALADDVRGAARAVQGSTVVDFVEESFTW